MKFTRQQIIAVEQRPLNRIMLMWLLVAFAPCSLAAQTVSDSSGVLKKVIVSANRKPYSLSETVPVQFLGSEKLAQIGASSIADAAKYFSGVLVKDYGGVGGLKTISVRSLGALNTGLLYDGIPVADAQSGQIDLGKFPATFIEGLELNIANPQQLPLPARALSSGAVLSVTTGSFNTTDFTTNKWQAGIQQGSFGLWQPDVGIRLPVGRNTVVSANAEAIWDKGGYPYTVDNGVFSLKTQRKNSDIRSFLGEVNVVHRFSDSSSLQAKLWGYNSERGLPGSVVFFNDIAVQRLWDKDFFIQSRYKKNIGTATVLLLSAKYSTTYTRYRDPNFQNNVGGLDDRYTQREAYLSAALSRRMGKYFLWSLASDLSAAKLLANIAGFADPVRTSLWNSLSVQYVVPQWQFHFSLLNTNISDKTAMGPAAVNKNEFTTAVSAGYKPAAGSPFLFRLFYKDVFRMPTFNDLYYTFISNINPKLLPEYARQYNAGITFSKNFYGIVSQIAVSGDAYYNSVKNKIVAVPAQNLFLWTMENIGKVDIKGIDINGEVYGKFSSTVTWSARLAFTWQHAIDVTDPASPVYKNEIPYTPQVSGSALVAVYYKSWTAGYSLLFSGNRYTLGENNPDNELTGWGTQDVFVARRLKFSGIDAKIRLGIDNILDTRYDVIRYYPMPGRSYKISITFNHL